MSKRVLTQQDVAEKAKVQKLQMTEADYKAINPQGHRQTPKPGGGYTWRNNWTTNEGGKITNVQGAINERMQKFDEADGARMASLMGRVERVPMLDARGAVNYVEPAQADHCALSNGWGHAWRAGGLVTRSGPDSMIFRLVRDEWSPTGRWCLGVPHDYAKPPKHGNADGTMKPGRFYADPDGNLWRYVRDEWVRV